MVRRCITIAFAMQAILLPFSALAIAATVPMVAESMLAIAGICTASLATGGWVIREYIKAGNAENLAES